MTPLVAGWLVLGIPLLLFGVVFLRRQQPVFLMYLAAAVIGLGYLTTTGAVTDIGGRLLGTAGSTAPAPTTAPAK